MPAPEMYRKRPVVIEALHLDAWSDLDRAALWCGGRVGTDVKPSDHTDVRHWIDIPTLEGTMRADLGDWIIKGVRGEFYPCKPDIFTATYERAEEQADASA